MPRTVIPGGKRKKQNMINKCRTNCCSRYMGFSSMRGLPFCERYPEGIPHAKVQGLDKCPYYLREKPNDNPPSTGTGERS